jgi:hypothetical protein
MRALALPALVLVLTGCAPVGARGMPEAAAEGPSAEDLRSAMYRVALVADTDGTVSVDVAPVVRHSCAPMARSARFRCCYVDNRGYRGTAIVQWEPSQDDPAGAWFWITGARHCSHRY